MFCTERSVNTFKDLESKSSTYVRYASSVNDGTLDVFLEKGTAQRSATKILSCEVELITQEVVEVGHCQVTEKKILEPWILEAKNSKSAETFVKQI